MANTSDFTQGNITKIILKFYFPLFLTNMLQQIYSFADAAIVGAGLGDDAFGAVGNIGSLTFFVIGFSLGLAIGFSVLIAQCFGAKEYEKLKNVSAAAIELAVLITIILTVISNIYLKPVLIFLQTDEKLLGDSLLYGHIIFYGIFASVSYNLSSATLRALGDSKTPLKAIIISSVLNVGLDALFIFGMKTGVEGAAIATVIAQVVASVVCIKKLAGIECMKLTKENFFNKPSLYLNLLKNGIPMAIMNSITAVGCMVVQYFVNGFGPIYTSAYSACSKYMNLFMQPACTAGHAMSAFTSQNYGAKKYDRIRSGLKVCVSIALVSYVTLGGAMVMFARPLADIFLDRGASIELTVGFMRITGVAIIAVDCLFVFRSGLQGMSYPTIPMISGIIEMVLRVATIVLLANKLGFTACALAEIAAWVGAELLNMIAFLIISAKKSRLADKNRLITE